MQYYFSKNSYPILNIKLNKHKLFILFSLIIFTFIPLFSWASAPTFFLLNSPLDTTLVIKKDIYPKIKDKQERLIEGKKYAFATINERKGMIALSGNFLSEMARAAGVEITDFLEWNDMNPTDPIQTGQVYYLQEKGSRAKDVATHILLKDQTLWDVSQKYAMRYKYLLKYNRLDENDKVKIGRVLWIQTKRPKRIPVEVRDITPIVATFDDNENKEEETAADSELMAEWEELKKTELAEVKNTETTNTEAINTTTQNDETTTSSQQGSFSEFDSKENNNDTQGVVISEKTDDKIITTNVVKYHTVAEAQSLYDISKEHNVTMLKLKEWNNLSDYTTYTGQKLIVSQPNSTKEDKVYDATLVIEKTDTNQDANSTSLPDKKVIVKQDGNGEFKTFIDSSGVLLPVPKKDFRPVEPSITNSNSDYHIVQKDETIWSIARKHNLSPKKIILWNGFITGDNIDVGDKIVLKSSLAVPAGSKSELEKNNTSSNNASAQNNNITSEGTQFKETALNDSTTKSKIGVLTIPMEEFLARGGNTNNIKNIGKEGYDVIGDPIVGHVFSNQKNDTTKITETKTDIYIVKPKDMLGKIAQSHKITTKEMMAWNPKIPKNGAIKIGDTLFVTKPQTTITETEQKQEITTVYPVEHYGAGFHAVQPHQTVYYLSEKYGVPVANIRKWNNLETGIIDLPVNKKMIINEGVLTMTETSNPKESQTQNTDTATTTQKKYSYHTVEKGETLFSIAKTHNLSTAQLREWNKRQGDLVYKGEKLIIGIE